MLTVVPEGPRSRVYAVTVSVASSQIAARDMIKGLEGLTQGR